MQEINNVTVQQQEEGINIQKLLSKAIAYWPWFVGSVLVCVIIAFLYLRYANPVYKINAKVLVKDEKKGADLVNSDLLQGLSGLGGKSNVDNEVEIFKSRTLMERVVKDLQLNVRYFVHGRVKESEQYSRLPFIIQLVPLYEDSIKGKSFTYTLKLTDKNGFTLTNAKDKTITGKLGDTLNMPFGRMLVDNTFYPADDKAEEYTIKISSLEAAVNKYMNALSVATPNKQVSTINLSLNEEVPDKGEVILDKLIEVYLQANVDDRNRIADSTMSFIDNRLALVGKELTGIEKDIQSFKQENELTDISEQSKLLLSNTSDYLKQLTEQQVQLSVVESLEKYLSDNSRRVIPASLTVDNSTFTSLLEKYNALQMERERSLMSTTESNPLIINLDKQIENLKQDLRGSLASVKRGIQVSINQLKQHTGSLDAQIRQVPAKERIYIEYSRQQAIKQELYLFLLKKREESAITKSSTIANARIVDTAKADARPFSPKKSMVLLSSLLVGLIIPAAGLYLKELLNTKVQSKEDITDRTTIPIVGQISHNEKEETVVVANHSRSQIAEQFRALRTNLQFMLNSKDDKVILLTSSMSGEGKSFVAINLAATMALSGKKVVLLEMDLRKPKVSQNLGLDNAVGFSSYITGQITLDKIIVNSGVLENLWVIPSGPIPPNPAELLMLPETNRFFEILRDNFDYILIDTAPVGLVTDALILANHADIGLYLVRQGYTFKQQLTIPNSLFMDKKMPRLSLIVNDIKFRSGSYGYSYGYGYGYGSYYGGGYFDNEGQNKRKISVIKERN